MVDINQSDATELFRSPPARYIDVGEGEVAYRRVGTGPDVLFCHGYPVSGATFRGMLPELAKKVTCHVIDFVGAGSSRFDRKTRIGLNLNISSVRRVVDALGLQRFSVVGHDSGGMIARHALAGDPRVSGMALINTEQPQGLGWRFRHFLFMAKLPWAEHLLAWAVTQRGLRKNEFLLGGCFHDRSLLDGEFEEFFLAPLRDNPDRRWASGRFVHSFDGRFVRDLSNLHRQINVPVQLVWGEGDPFFPVVLGARDGRHVRGCAPAHHRQGSTVRARRTPRGDRPGHLADSDR